MEEGERTDFQFSVVSGVTVFAAALAAVEARGEVAAEGAEGR